MERTELRPGTVLHFPKGQSFTICRTIGGGGSALIYEAKETGSELYCAIKELYPAGGFVRRNGEIVPLDAEETMEELKAGLEQREVRLSQLASRRNFQVLFSRSPVWQKADIQTPEGTWQRGVKNTYVRMDSLREKGCSLKEFLERKRAEGTLTLDTVIAVIETVLEAYAALHRDGFLHGDCQAGNLFLLGNGQDVGTACIIDFGAAWELLPDGKTAPVTGDLYSTDGYCAPELLFQNIPAFDPFDEEDWEEIFDIFSFFKPKEEEKTGDKSEWPDFPELAESLGAEIERTEEPFRLTPACDVWSLGYLMLTMLTDRGLEELPGITEYLMTHPGEKCLSAAEAKALGCTRAQEELLNRLLQRSLQDQPNLRYETAGKMAKALRTLRCCRKMDGSAPLSKEILWESACRYRKKEPTRFQTEHIPTLVEELPVKHLTVYGSLNGGSTRPAADLLEEWLRERYPGRYQKGESSQEFVSFEDIFAIFNSTEDTDVQSASRDKERKVPPKQEGTSLYLHAPGGGGKSFAAAELMVRLLEDGTMIPLYLDLDGMELPEGGTSLCRELARCYPGMDDPQALEAYFRAEKRVAEILLILDNLHKVPRKSSADVLETFAAIEREWKNVRLLVMGRTEDPAEQAEKFGFGYHMALKPIPVEEINAGVEAVWKEKPNPYDPEIEERLYRLQEWARHLMRHSESVLLEGQYEALGLPLLFMRYLEVFAADERRYDPPTNTAAVLVTYFSQWEYRRNGQEVHELLNRTLPEIAYRSIISGAAGYRREEIGEWLREIWGSFGWYPEREEAFFTQTVENLAVLYRGGDGTYHFVHDCYQEYFAARFIADRLRCFLAERDEKYCRAIAHGWWPAAVNRLWPEYCVGEFREGRFVSLWDREEFFYQLRLALKESPSCRFVAANIADALKARREKSEARQWTSLAAEAGDPGCLLELAEEARTQGYHAVAYRLYGKAAEEQSAKAQLYMGDAGEGETAFRWYKAAAEQGLAEAQVKLGFHYVCGIGTEKNAEKAVEWFRKAAQEELEAKVALGCCFLWGIGVKQSLQDAHLLLEAGANRKHVHALYLLARLYEQGTGRYDDRRYAKDLYRRGGEQGHPDGCFRSGAKHLYGGKIDAGLAKYWYLWGAQSGDKGMQYSYGVYLQQTRPDCEEAVQWYGDAAEQDHAGAQKALADCLLTGRGCGKDEKKALFWYRKAADNGYAEAVVSLARMYLEGTGMDAPDYEKAWYLYEVAVWKGVIEANLSLAEMCEKGLGRKKDAALAAEYRRKAQEKQV